MTESKQNSSPESLPEKNTKTRDGDSNNLPKSSVQKATASRSDSQPSSDKPSPKSTIKKPPTKLSKLAVLAIIIALLALAACGGLYYWFSQQQLQVNQQLQQQTQQQLALIEKNTQQALAKQQQNLTKQLSQQLQNTQQNIEQKNSAVVQKVESAVARLSEVQPTNWLAHEAEYLIRVAGRSLWLERKPQSAISLLRDANNRLKELNDPSFLPVRESIQQDIELLESLPTLDTEQVILTLMALAKQSQGLVFKLAYLPDDTTKKEDLTLSTESSWENVKKSWQQFMADFITVKHRTGKAAPLLSPKQQQNLTTNLQLKIQQAQWAASKENKALFQASLTDIGDWLTTYYDMDNTKNKTFNQTLTQLKSAIVELDYPNQLNSLNVIRAKITQSPSNNFSAVIPVQKSPSSTTQHQINTLPNTGATL